MISGVGPEPLNMQDHLILSRIPPEAPKRVFSDVASHGTQERSLMFFGTEWKRQVADARVSQSPHEFVLLMVRKIDTCQIERPQAGMAQAQFNAYWSSSCSQPLQNTHLPANLMRRT
jgi:hypothetical protein